MSVPLSVVSPDVTDNPSDPDMLITQSKGRVFIWCSCELVMHVWDVATQHELPELGNDFVMFAMTWSRDEFLKLVDQWERAHG